MKRFFLGGLKALLPTILTLWVLTAVVGFIRDYVATPVTNAIHWSLITNKLGQDILESTTPVRVFDRKFIDPGKLEPGETVDDVIARARARGGFFLDLSKIHRPRLYRELSNRIPPAFGFAIGFLLIFVLGFFARGYLGKHLIHKGEKILFSFPLVRSIYPYAKKIVEFFIKDREKTKREFQTVVAVPYPKEGMFTLGFVTSDGLRSLNEVKGETFIAVFLPSSPTPMTGYVCFVNRDEIVPLTLTFDQAMGLIISGGVIVPEQEMVDPRERSQLREAIDRAPTLARPKVEGRDDAAVTVPLQSVPLEQSPSERDEDTDS